MLVWVGIACVSAGGPGGGEAPADPPVVAFGDPHVHTGASGDGCSADVGPPDPGCGAFADVVEAALDEGLSWFALTDHVNGPQLRTDEGAEVLWRATVDAALSASGIVILPGAEVELETEEGTLGHRSVLFFDDALSGLQREAVGPRKDSSLVASCNAVGDWVAELRERAGPLLLMPHHPAAFSPMPTDWACLTDADGAVELYSRWGNSRRVVSGTQPWADYDPLLGGPTDRTEVAGTVTEAVTARADRPLAFFAGTDQHRTTPGAVCNAEGDDKYGGGITGVLLPADAELTREALGVAMEQRHTFASTGPRVPVRVAVFREGGAWVGGMGDRVEGVGVYSLEVNVADPEVWDDDIRAATAIFPFAGEPAGELRRALVRVAPGVFEGEGYVSVADGQAITPVYVELVLDGLDAHPPGCRDAPFGVPPDDTERLWTSPTWFTSSVPG